MSFNPDVSNQAPEVIFFRKKYIKNNPVAFFNNLPINKKSGLLLDGKLLFFEHVNEKLKKMIKSINLLWKLNLTFRRSPLLTTYKSSLRPRLCYGNSLQSTK